MNRITPRPVQFRTRPETEKREERTRTGKIAAAVGGLAAVGIAGKIWHGQYAKTRTANEHAARMRTDANYAEKWNLDQAKNRQVIKARKDAEKALRKSYDAKAAAPAALSKPPTTPAVKTAPATPPPAPKNPARAKLIRQRVQVKQSTIAAKINAAAGLAPKAVAQAVQPVRRMSAITPRAIFFSQSRHGDGTFEVGTNPLSIYRKASRVVPWVNRASEAAGDVGDIAAGKKPKDPFYKKSWFKRTVQTAAIAAPVGAYALTLKQRGRTARGEAPLSGLAGKIANRGDKVLKKFNLSAKITPRAVHFATVDPLEKGWDLRDARGRSARVYAPGSRRRERREKEWGEKTQNIRLVRNAAIATTAGLGALAIYQGKKLRQVSASKLKTKTVPAGTKVAAAIPFPKQA